MRSIKSFLRKLDMFGVSYNFRYKSREKYQTSLGGFFILLFVILVLGMGIYYFIPFIVRLFIVFRMIHLKRSII